ncbi:MAG: hypothetical protein D3903_04855 [Candidatus Electrothrix sp. GM3_4]|nr:hypothetical protein [Candidatus Electrothrix sp. GM3_4]
MKTALLAVKQGTSSTLIEEILVSIYHTDFRVNFPNLILLKEERDSFLQETIALDRQQMQSESPEELRSIIDQITEVKIKALEDLTNEKLRSDQMFSTLLMQCHNINCKIQNKIALIVN